jgi:UPF0716 protein FxsA
VGALLVVAFLIVPIVEIYVIIQVGQVIGAWPTVLLLVLESMLGAWIVKREGRRAFSALRGAAGTGRMPAKELADAGLVLVGGTLLLTPGFVTDVVGFFFVLPPTRPLARRLLGWFIARRAVRVVAVRTGWSPPTGGAGGPGVPGARPTPPRVVPGETVPPPDAEGNQPPDRGPGRAAGG